MTSYVHWKEVGDGTWALYEGKLELFRAANEEAMTAIIDFSNSEFYHHLISMNCGVEVYSEDGTRLKRKTRPLVGSVWEYDYEI